MKLDDLAKSPNVCELLSEEKLKDIGLLVKADYDEDKTSRVQWEERYKKAMELAMQVSKKKTFPWPSASNVKFPLLTIAALNFHAKAYPSLINSTGVVKQRVIGQDPEGTKQARADKVSQHMSYQLLEQSPWEAETDKGLLVLSIMGTIFKKTVMVDGCIYSDLVLPQDLVVNYYAQDINDCRVSHCFQLWPNDVRTKVLDGEYLDIDCITQPKETGPIEVVRQETQGLLPPPSGPCDFVEQQTWLDLDEDGYAEPYFVTFHKETGVVRRILARWKPSGVRMIGKKVAEIIAEQLYTKYDFIPAADGGFYGMGLGQLLGPLNKTVDTLINQLIDAGTMATLGGGFLGRGARFKYGQTQLKPFEWVNVDSTGSDLRESIFPLPVRDPSAVLYNLLVYLVGYGERVGSSGDLQMGQLPDGGNIKAKAAEIANENGRIIFEAIYKRIWRSMKSEFKVCYRWNQLTVGTPLGDKEIERLFNITPEDYSDDDKGICPAADPNVVSNSARKEQAQLVYATALQSPGHDLYEVTKNLYQAWQVDGIDRFLPPPGSEKAKALQPGPSIEMLDLKNKEMTAQARLIQAQAMQMKVVGELQLDAQKVGAEILDLQSKAAKQIAEAKGVDVDNLTNLFNAQIQAAKTKQEGIFKTIDSMMRIMESVQSTGATAGTQSMAGPAANPAVLQEPAMVPENVEG